MSSSLPELESYIAFRLHQLGERNEHHEFEQIATRIARKRISANIVVANGPVSAGGDQQRDAESYTTRIPDELPNAAGFAASAATSATVVACTVQKTGLKGKILADLAGICSEGASPVDLVAFFSVASIAEAVTHELQKKAREDYGVTLDVYSGMKIATLLAEPDLVWVAQHHLQVPSSMVPPPDTEATPSWYGKLLTNLRNYGGPVALTPATQGEISEGLRYATFDPTASADLPEWLSFMEAFLNPETSGELQFRACYEISVAQFRGMGFAGASEALIRRAVDYAGSVTSPSVLDDASTLMFYWGNMWMTGVSSSTAGEISGRQHALLEHIRLQLQATDRVQYPVRASSLLATLIYMHFQPKWERLEDRGFTPRKVERAPHAGKRLDPMSVDPAFAEFGLLDLDRAMMYLDQLVSLIPEARAFPISSLAQLFDLFAPALSSRTNYAKIRDALDVAVSTVEGDGSLAERCRDRAIGFSRAGKPLEALAEMHSAKVKWFHGDSMHGAVVAARYIAKLYASIGFVYAGKMYAASAIMFAHGSADVDLKAQVPKALFELAELAHSSGCWVDAAALTEVALLAHNSYSVNAFDASKHDDLSARSLNELMALLATRAFWRDRECLLRDSHSTTRDWFDDLAEQASAPGAALPFDEREYQELARDQFYGPILGDLGPTREIAFSALGVGWAFKFDNDRVAVLLAEQFVAALQVFLADVARFEPVIIGANVRVIISYVGDDDVGQSDLTIEQSGEEVEARLVLHNPPSNMAELSRWLVATCMQLLSEVHPRPDADLLSVLNAAMQEGLVNKILVGRPYVESADFLSDEHYERCAGAQRPSSSVSFLPKVHDSLAPSISQGPGYDRIVSLEAIAKRYTAAEAWQLSFKNFVEDERGREAIADLRDNGWLDWQILMAFQNVGLNWRAQRETATPGQLSPAEMYELASRPEEETDPRIPVEYIQTTLDQNLLLQTLAVARSWDIRSRGECTDSGYMRDLLNRRYGFAVDDVEHADLLT